MEAFLVTVATSPPSNVALASSLVPASPVVAVVVSVDGGTPVPVSEISLSPVGSSCPSDGGGTCATTTGSGSGSGSGSTPQYLSTAVSMVHHGQIMKQSVSGGYVSLCVSFHP